MSDFLKWTDEDGEPWALALWGHVAKTSIKPADVRVFLHDIDQQEFYRPGKHKVEHLFVKEDEEQAGSWADIVWVWCDENDLGAKPITAVRF